ncbi:general APC amino acid permease [Suillus placidus]|uniref:General APC amino acid permease n=1 Tax=Suillus placidus TaxID=48579 RepID=A0A9P7A5M1_9AGAM|nr:general APC amino acid permease [Suillus placidus]
MSNEDYKFDANRNHVLDGASIAGIAGTLSTGLLLGSGKALSGAGPVGALIAYALIGSDTARWVDPALGFATNHAGIYTAIIIVFACATNVFGVRYAQTYNLPAEFVLSIIKFTMITGLILVGLVIDLGGSPNHHRLGFQYWKNPGVLAGAQLEPTHVGLDRFLGILNALVQASFSYQGMKLVAVSAPETESPRRNVAKAVCRVLFRTLVFYILGIFITGLIIPYNDPNLLHSKGTAAKSPYVIAMTNAGIKVLPSIINAGVMTSAFSAANSFLYCSSRILYSLALYGQAPKIFARCIKSGLPHIAVGFYSIVALFALMNIKSGSATVFNWFVNLSTVGGFFGWGSINLTYLFFHCGMKSQGIDHKKLHYWNRWLSIWGLGWCIFFILINGFPVFWSFSTAGFFTAYINIPLFFGLYFGWKYVKKTEIWRPEEMDFVTGIPTPEETEAPYRPPEGFWQKLADVLF